MKDEIERIPSKERRTPHSIISKGGAGEAESIAYRGEPSHRSGLGLQV
jgi:hypothetical protein